jgi:hypothetical protein
MIPPLDRLLSLPLESSFRCATGIKVPPFRPGQRAVLLKADGPGAVTRISLSARLGPRAFRGLVFRAWWDGEKVPSVEVPLGDFFGVGHVNFTGLPPSLRLSTPLLARAPDYGLDAFFPMPFAKGARIEVANDSAESFDGVLYSHLDWRRFERPPATPLRFHAAWRRECPAERRGRPFTLLEARGKGWLVGACYHVQKLDPEDRWTHGGGDQLFLDGETAPVFTHTVGGENWIGGSGGCAPWDGPGCGCHFADPAPRKKTESGWCQDEGGRWSIHRFFLEGPVCFRSSVRWQFGCLANDISSTAYWYQEKPHAPFTRLPPHAERVALAPCPPRAHLRPLASRHDFPVALLGPFQEPAPAPWSPRQGVNLARRFPTNYARPFGFALPPRGRRPAVRWLKTSTRLGFLDLTSVYRPKLGARGLRPDDNLAHAREAPSAVLPGATCFIAARVRSDRPQAARLLAGRDSQRLRAWLNGAPLRGGAPAPDGAFAEAAFDLRLRRGWNEIVLESALSDLGDLFVGWVLSLRLLAEDGLSPARVRFDRWAGAPDAHAGTFDHANLWRGEQR